MAITERCYRIAVLPDLSLTKYASLDGNGVDGVLERHLAFLRQWNRKGVLSGTSMHLFCYYDGQDPSGAYGIGEKGSKLEILFLIRGEEERMKNVPELVSSSTLYDYFKFIPCRFEDFLDQFNINEVTFPMCSTLLKKEVFIRSSLDVTGEESGYYTVPQWEMNEDGRLYNMLKLMEALDQRMLYRIDLYPVERSGVLRDALRKPMTVLRERQYAKAGATGQRDFEAENVLKGYQDLLDNIDSSPHFAVNAFVFGYDAENTAVVLDAAGAEALKKGSYEIATFAGRFSPHAFLDTGPDGDLHDRRKNICAFKSQKGLIVCKEESRNFKLCHLPTLFTLEEVAPFFRFPTLYEGETVQKRKETAPEAIPADKGLYLGSDDNGYDVYFPLEKLAKHAFISGVPGSGKTITMCHLTSTLWKKHNIPFLVLEPAKQEYRALANEPGMEGLYLFSPNADMSFPLHINPFEFPKGLMLAEHIRRLCSVFEGAFPLENPMPFLLDTAIEAVYRELGWTPETVYTDETKLKFPTVSMLYRRLEEELKVTTYSEEIRGNLESALKVRIGSLLRREMGDVFDVPKSTIPPEKWLEIPAVIELESMGTGPANFLTLMLCALIREVLKVNPQYDGEKEKPRHMIFIEEAHNLIGPESEEASGAEANPKQAATAFVVKMLAEVRALKEGIVIADQLPTVMAQEVLKNTGLKIGLRITSADDRGLLGSTMSASSTQLEEMATFTPGRALISYEGLLKPFAMYTHKWRGPVGGSRCEQAKCSRDWCKAECPHYKDQTCFPDDTEWDAATTPKRDTELLESMRGRAPYQEICQRSFIIESAGFGREFSQLSDRVEDTLAHIRELNEQEVQIKKLEARVLEMGQELLAIPDWENNQEQIDMIQNTADYVNQLKLELKTKYLASPKFQKTYDTIVDCMVFVRRLQDRKKHWKKLGVQGFKGVGIDPSASYPSEQIKQMVHITIEMQKTAILLAQQLYVLASPHMANAGKICKEIEAVAATFKVKNIMRK